MTEPNERRESLHRVSDRTQNGDGMNRKPGPTAAEGRRRLNQHPPAEPIAGAKEDSCRRLGRGLAPKELERVLRRYPGDP